MFFEKKLNQTGSCPYHFLVGLGAFLLQLFALVLLREGSSDMSGFGGRNGLAPISLPPPVMGNLIVMMLSYSEHVLLVWIMVFLPVEISLKDDYGWVKMY